MQFELPWPHSRERDCGAARPQRAHISRRCRFIQPVFHALPLRLVFDTAAIRKFCFLPARHKKHALLRTLRRVRVLSRGSRANSHQPHL